MATLKNAIVLPTRCAVVINQQTKQFNLRITEYSLMRRSTQHDVAPLRMYVMDDGEVKRAFAARTAAASGSGAGPSSDVAPEEPYLQRMAHR